MRITRLLAAALLVAAAIATTAFAATKNGITPVSPKAGGKVALGKSATFTFKSVGEGTAWVHVCKSAKKNSKGVICNKQFIGQAKKRGKNFKATQKFFDYPAFWLNNAGTYYWQAHRIDCSADLDDCLIEGPVVKFKVG